MEWTLRKTDKIKMFCDSVQPDIEKKQSFDMRNVRIRREDQKIWGQ